MKISKRLFIWLFPILLLGSQATNAMYVGWKLLGLSLIAAGAGSVGGELLNMAKKESGMTKFFSCVAVPSFGAWAFGRMSKVRRRLDPSDEFSCDAVIVLNMVAGLSEAILKQ